MRRTKSTSVPCNMLIYAGIDEAGYGPMLGPLTVGCAAFVFPNLNPEDGAPPMWSLLKSAVAKNIKTAKGRIIVNDSKKLKLPNSNLDKPHAKHPLTHLEYAVLAFLHVINNNTIKENNRPAVTTDRDFFDRILPRRNEAIDTLRWYLGEAIPLPVTNDAASQRIAGNLLARSLAHQNARLESFSCRMLTEPQFNRLTDKLNSKAAANFLLIGKHIAQLFQRYGKHHPRIIIDRQSGRSRYREPLHQLFPDSEIRIIAEEDSFSRYQLTDDDNRGMVITFAKSAEDKHLPVALASMIAKYTRELMMMRLNRFFKEYLPDLKPTAGYVQDARRFLRDIEVVIRDMNINTSQLIRNR